MKRLPSESTKLAPLACAINSGVSSTAFHARTGELTAPGIVRRARSNNAFEFSFIAAFFIGLHLFKFVRLITNRKEGQLGKILHPEACLMRSGFALGPNEI